MAGLSELEVRVGMDIGGLKSGVQQAQNQLKLFETALKKSTDIKEIEYLSKSVGFLKSKLEVLNASQNNLLGSTTNLVKGSNQAGQALLNLGRVAQDAPFGFMGIANNLNPLLESFQRLRAETGSAGSALKALGTSILGAGGIGLALSVFQFLALGGADSIKKLFASAKDASLAEAKTDLDKFNKSLREVESSSAATGLKLQSFVNIARDGNLPLIQRNEAIKEANKILGEHGEKLNIVNINTAAVTEQIQKYTQATIQQALATKFADRASDLVIKQRDAVKAYTVAIDNQAKAEQQLRDIANKPTSAGGAAGAALFAEKARDKTIKAANAYKLVTSELKDLTGQLTAAQLASTGLFGELGTKGKPKPNTEKDIKDLKTKKDLLKEITDELERNVRTTNNQEAIGVISIKERDIQLVKAYENAIKSLFDIGVNPNSQLAKGIAIDFNIVQSRVNFDKTLNEVVKTQLMPGRFQNGLSAKIDFPVEPSLKLRKDVYFKEIAAFGKESEAIINSTIQTAFGGFGETLGNLISGKANIGEGFKSLFGVIADGMKQLGEAMIGLGTAKIALEKFKFAPGVGTVIAGVGVIALSSILKNAIPKFAEGTSNFRGGMALVGERGPELVRLPSGSDVIPNHALNQFGSGSNVYVADVTLRGSDLLLAFDRASGRRGRNG